MVGFDSDGAVVPENVGVLEVCLDASTGDFFGNVEVDLNFLSLTALGT